jgi:hypothetical protein
LDNEQPNIDLDFADITAFFEAAGVNSVCPACGNTKWTVLDDLIDGGERKHLALGLASNANEGLYVGGANLPVVVAFCNRCSYCRMHGRKKILSWVKAGRQPLIANEQQ